ncbi:cyclin-D3-2-like [Primulina eburnea]|uniref:cyclin-D3-2-like n=1 Tax=Primulina eburnea TaxID=1245227 RepID=UPI003C6C050C
MVSHFQEQESLLQNSIFDDLYCEEERFEDDLSGGSGLRVSEIDDFNEISGNPFDFLGDRDLFWEDDELLSLLSKEKEQSHLSYDAINSDGCLKMVRNEAVKWMLKGTACYGFTAMTAVLAVNYFDRFIASVFFKKDKPWMSQLLAVACLSIAAKVEETQVPLLVNFQMEESEYLFEAQTIQRMELLVLSTLKWKMNPVTPISYIDHIVRRLGLIGNLHWQFLGRCQNLILSIVTDCRFMCYLPSVIASATMLNVIKEIDPYKDLEFQNQFMSLFKMNKEKLDECHKLVKEVLDGHVHKLCHKRKHESIPSSPSCVVDAYFSSDSSNDSWAVASFASSSPKPMLKRSRAQDQHMSLASLSSPCWRG